MDISERPLYFNVRRRRRRRGMTVSPLSVGNPLAEFPATGILDNYNRANEGPPPSANYVTPLGQGGLKVLSNACGTDVPVNSGMAMWSQLFNADQEVHIRVKNLVVSQSFIIVVRNQSATEWIESYWAEFTNGTPATVSVFKFADSVTTVLVNAAALGANLIIGMQLGLRIVSSVLTVWRGSSQVVSVPDFSITGSGRIAVKVSHDGMDFDDLGGGSL